MNNCDRQNSCFVSVLLPCRNEEKFIGKCLDSIIVNDYPKDKLEVLVIDGIRRGWNKGNHKKIIKIL